MQVSRLTVSSFVCLVLATVVSAKAANDDAPAGSKIDTWMEGSITQMDLGKGKFTVHGAKRPYATQYSKMMNEVTAKTAKLEGAAKETKIAEIRGAWADTLNKAAAEPREKDSDFNFHVAAKDGTVLSYEEDQNRTTPVTDFNMTQHNFSEFSVGQYVLVGYAFGVVNNEVSVIAKTTRPASVSVNAGFKETTPAIAPVTDPAAAPVTAPKTAPVIGDATKLAPETEQAREIRKSLTDDKSLSTSAQNINIEVKDGIAHLKGSVTSETEKSAVEAKAASVVGETKVMSHLEVNTK